MGAFNFTKCMSCGESLNKQVDINMPSYGNVKRNNIGRIRHPDDDAKPIALCRECNRYSKGGY